MEQRLSLITLGVADLARSRRFYAEGLGWTPGLEAAEVVFFQAGGLIVALYDDLPRDAGIEAEGRPYGGLIALAHNVRERDQVDAVIARAQGAGAGVPRPARDTDWGGRSGYFTDPDGHLWEIAWNPGFRLDEDGRVFLGAG